MEPIEVFVEKLIEEKGFGTEPLEVQAQIKTDLIERIERRIDAMILASIPESEHGAFETLLDKGDGAAIHEFIRTHIPDIEEKTAEQLLEFKKTYLK